jgi:hypothetical protein
LVITKIARKGVWIFDFTIRNGVRCARFCWRFVKIGQAEYADVLRRTFQLAAYNIIDMAFGSTFIGIGCTCFADIVCCTLLCAVNCAVCLAGFYRTLYLQIVTIVAGDARVNYLVKLFAVFEYAGDTGLVRWIEVVLALIAAIAFIRAGLEFCASFAFVGSIVEGGAPKASTSLNALKGVVQVVS